MTVFYFIRHGMTDAVGHVLTGTAEGVALNAAGRDEVARLVDAMRPVRLTAVVSSPLERARDTAAPIAESHGLGVDVDAAFTEIEFGGWTFQTMAQLDRDERWRRFNAVRSLTRAPDGELMLDVQRRAVAAALRLAEAHPDGRVAVVSHGDVIRAMLLYFLGMPIDFVHRIEVSPARISVVEIGTDGLRVRQLNGAVAPACI